MSAATSAENSLSCATPIMSPWLRLVEVLLVEQLLRTPMFHRGVEKVVRAVHRIQHGQPPDEMGGTRLDPPNANESFLRHFNDEIKAQLGRAEARTGAEDGRLASGLHGRSALGNGRSQPPPPTVEDDGSAEAVWRNAVRSARTKTSEPQTSRHQASATEQRDESADATWRDAQRRAAEAPKDGFMQEYMDALRKQMRKGGK